MAKKISSFAADFEGINKSADDKVLAMLRSAEKTNEVAPKPPVVAKTTKPTSAKLVEKTGTEKPKVESVQSEKKKTTKSKSAVEWGKPVAHFNTRIPEKMSELLDDLVYQKKKQGNPCTKQAIAIEALENYLRQEGMLSLAN